MRRLFHYPNSPEHSDTLEPMNLPEKLSQACQGLLMPSESEYPFEFFIWKGEAPATPEKVCQLAQYSADPVEEIDLDYFFRNVAQQKDWHDDIQSRNVSKFKALIETLKSSLQAITVYRIGTINIAIYIVGQTDTRDLAGLSTQVVET
jgi:hypothetical protein